MVHAMGRDVVAAAVGAVVALVLVIWLGNRYRLDEDTAVR
jgi:hypothetical protein